MEKLLRFVALLFTLLWVIWSTIRSVVILWRPLGHRCFLLLLKRIGHKSQIFKHLQEVNDALIIVQFLPKRYQKNRYLIGYKSCVVRFFSKKNISSVTSKIIAILSLYQLCSRIEKCKGLFPTHGLYLNALTFSSLTITCLS